MAYSLDWGDGVGHNGGRCPLPVLHGGCFVITACRRVVDGGLASGNGVVSWWFDASWTVVS